ERDAKQSLKKEKRQRIEAESKLASRAQMGRKAFVEKRVPKIIANGRKMAAQVSAGKLRTEVAEKEAEARGALDEAGRRVRGDASMKIELPDPEISAARRIATISDAERSWVIQGPERVALIGRNGAGKTTLLEQLAAAAASHSSSRTDQIGPESSDSAGSGGASRNYEPRFAAAARTDRIGYLPQRIDGLDESRSVIENI